MRLVRPGGSVASGRVGHRVQGGSVVTVSSLSTPGLCSPGRTAASPGPFASHCRPTSPPRPGRWEGFLLSAHQCQSIG